MSTYPVSTGKRSFKESLAPLAWPFTKARIWFEKGWIKLAQDKLASHPDPSFMASLINWNVKQPVVLDQDAGKFTPFGKVLLFTFASKGYVVCIPS